MQRRHSLCKHRTSCRLGVPLLQWSTLHKITPSQVSPFHCAPAFPYYLDGLRCLGRERGMLIMWPNAGLPSGLLWKLHLVLLLCCHPPTGAKRAHGTSSCGGFKCVLTGQPRLYDHTQAAAAAQNSAPSRPHLTFWGPGCILRLQEGPADPISLHRSAEIQWASSPTQDFWALHHLKAAFLCWFLYSLKHLLAQLFWKSAAKIIQLWWPRDRSMLTKWNNSRIYEIHVLFLG